MSYRFNGAAFEPFYDGKPLASVKAVWYRKPELALPDNTSHPNGYDDFTRHAMSLFMRQLYGLLPEALWISDYYALLRASDKLHQLTTAQKLGFNVPDTLVTSSAVEAQAFVRSHKSAIAKPIEVKVFTLNGQQRMMFAQKVDGHTDFSGLHLAPAMLQEAIDVAFDIRVTVVGKEVFAASVSPRSKGPMPQNTRDWRVGDHYGGTNIQAFDLPKAIATLCRTHVAAMGLQYGGIDLILDKKGTFWFLENNPNGQWAFIEDVTGQPIGKAIARLLKSTDER